MSEQFFAAALKEVCQEIRIQNLTKHVRPFHGEGASKFTNWLTDMDQLAITVDSERMCVLATLTLGGLAGTFVSRLLKENQNIQWCSLRQKLRERFSDYADLSLAQEQCRRLKQRKDETVQNFAERLRSAATDAFDTANPDTQRTLVEIFQKGVQNDQLSRNLIRKKFQTLDQAMEYAADEARTDKCFQLYRDKPAPTEPMDVDAVRTDNKLDQLQNDLGRLTKQLDRMNRRSQYRTSGPPPRPQGVHPRQHSAPPRFRTAPPPRFPSQTRPPTNPPRPPTGTFHTHFTAVTPPPLLPPSAPRPGRAGSGPSGPGAPPAAGSRLPAYQWTVDGRPICAACGRVGHRHRQCRTPREN